MYSNGSGLTLTVQCVVQLRLVFTSDRVRVGVVIRGTALYDLVKTAF